MKKAINLLTASLFLLSPVFSQDNETDSLKTLQDVTVRAFEQNRKQSTSTVNVKVLRNNNGDRYNKSSMVNGFNSIAGVRMEERSPGSYRINIRGSSLRSPFGVRNVKVYWNGIPFTDPGGNTYFNQFAWNNLSTIELFKGPAGSLYGAGTGGLLLIDNFSDWKPGAGIEYITGSYGLQNIFLSGSFGKDDSKNLLTYAHNQSDGYRVQTRMRRDNFSWQTKIKASEKQEIVAGILFTDMYYQTPGALTLAEYNNNPKAARPAGGGFPSAVNAKAAIFQKNVTAGFTSHYQLSEQFKNSTTLYGSFSQIKNSAIRNYERRTEPSFGGRTVFSWSKKQTASTIGILGGAEFQQGYFNTQVAKNKNGNPDTLQSNDDINSRVLNLFLQGDIAIKDSWFITGGLSVTQSHISISRLSSYPVVKQTRSYRNELAPRISLLKKINTDLSVLVSAAKGFSPPTTAEVLPSTGVISTFLEAEHGWNYEGTIRYALFKRTLQLEATGFYFRLNDALVQRRDLSGADYFVNAGDIKQKGVEFHADYIHAFKGKLIDYLLVRGAYTYSDFQYGSFVKGSDNFSGKTVPSVPRNIISALADLKFRNGIYTNLTFYSASKIYLNDANTFTAGAYELLGARLGWQSKQAKKIRLNVYAGADNLLDEKYSLGNDINAAANRFYNAAPRRNYYAGVAFQWISQPKK